MTLSKKVIIGIALGIGFIFSAIVLGLLPVYNRKYRSSTQVTVVTSTNERITIPKGIFVPATTTINNNPTFLSTASVKTMPTKVAIITNTKVYTTFEDELLNSTNDTFMVTSSITDISESINSSKAITHRTTTKQMTH